MPDAPWDLTTGSLCSPRHLLTAIYDAVGSSVMRIETGRACFIQDKSSLHILVTNNNPVSLVRHHSITQP